MGFGMQKWIYSQRPRRAFTKFKRRSFETEEVFTTKDLNISGRIHKNPTKQDRKILLEKLNRNILRNKILSIIVIIVIISSVLILIIKLEPWTTKERTKEYLTIQLKEEHTRKTEVYQISLLYGQYNFKEGEYTLAKKDFQKALDIFPDDNLALEYLVKSYIKDCLENDKECEKTIHYLDKLIAKDPDNIEYNSFKIALENKLK